MAKARPMVAKCSVCDEAFRVDDKVIEVMRMYQPGPDYNLTPVRSHPSSHAHLRHFMGADA